jgi:hypothetical protein
VPFRRNSGWAGPCSEGYTRLGSVKAARFQDRPFLVRIVPRHLQTGQMCSWYHLAKAQAHGPDQQRALGRNLVLNIAHEFRVGPSFHVSKIARSSAGSSPSALQLGKSAIDMRLPGSKQMDRTSSVPWGCHRNFAPDVRKPTGRSTPCHDDKVARPLRTRPTLHPSRFERIVHESREYLGRTRRIHHCS